MCRLRHLCSLARSLWFYGARPLRNPTQTPPDGNMTVMVRGECRALVAIVREEATFLPLDLITPLPHLVALLARATSRMNNDQTQSLATTARKCRGLNVWRRKRISRLPLSLLLICHIFSVTLPCRLAPTSERKDSEGEIWLGRIKLEHKTWGSSGRLH